MTKELLHKIGELSVKMRYYKAIQEAEAGLEDLKDRELVLLELLGSKGPMNIAELRTYVYPEVRQSTISGDVKKFRTMGLVEKRFGVEDERVHLVELTPTGIDKVKQIKAKRIERLSLLDEAIGNDPDVLPILNDVVDRCIKRVDQELRLAKSGR